MLGSLAALPKQYVEPVLNHIDREKPSSPQAKGGERSVLGPPFDRPYRNAGHNVQVFGSVISSAFVHDAESIRQRRKNRHRYNYFLLMELEGGCNSGEMG